MKLDFLKKKSVYIPIAIVVFVVLLLTYFGNRKPTLTTTVVAKLENLSQEVTVSGAVKAKEAVELAFEKGGRIRSINANVGDHVTAGSIVLALENGVEISAVEDAQAKLASKQAHFDDLKAGGRPEEIALKESGLAKAESDLATDYSQAPNIILDAYNKTDNAIHRQADILFGNTSSSNPQINFNSGDQQAVIDAQAARFSMQGMLSNFKNLIQTPLTTTLETEKALSQAKDYLLAANDFLIKTSRVLNAAINLSESTLATDKDALSTARTNINTALTNINDQIQTIATQKITVQTSKNDLELTKAPATVEVLAGATADIDSAKANVRNAQALLLKTYIVSPISGVITKQDGKIGQIASGNSPIVAVMSGNFKVEAFVPEVDVAKIAVGNPADITLDAYGSDVVFSSHVVKVDPAETIIDNVSTYKATLEFDKDDARIRSGMTANTDIQTAERKNALSLPQRAVYEKLGKKFVRVTTDGKNLEEREVTVGIRGSNGDIEILSGLEAGETVMATGK
ncbi:MAG: efflux RND transporter periplasmic adaptor subunit [Patescibacteria group bacterium]